MSEAVQRHAPVRGWTARLLGRFHVTGSFWYRIHHWGVQRPAWMVAPFVNLFTFGFFFALIRIRKAVWHNLEAVLGKAGFFRRNWGTYKTLHTFAWCLTAGGRRGSSPGGGLPARRDVGIRQTKIRRWAH